MSFQKCALWWINFRHAYALSCRAVNKMDIGDVEAVPLGQGEEALWDD